MEGAMECGGGAVDNGWLSRHCERGYARRRITRFQSGIHLQNHCRAG